MGFDLNITRGHMKTVQLFQWTDLGEKQQSLLLKKQINLQLKWVIEVGFEEWEELYSNLAIAWQKANKMQTPWFIGEYIMDDPELKKYIEAIAEACLEETLYSDLDVDIVDIPTGIE